MRFPHAAAVLVMLVGSGLLAPATRGAEGTASGGFAPPLTARLGTAQVVDTKPLAAELAALPEEERIEQLRDWALLASLAQLGTESRTLDWGKLTPGLPSAFRRPYLNGLRELPHGPGRLAVLRPGECLAVVPAVADPGADRPRFRFSALCRLLDERRLLDGGMPRTVHVVAYDADPRRQPPALALTYLGSLEGAVFETADYGFETARITTIDELADFLLRSDDLLEARQDGAALVLKGRRYPASQYRRDPRRIDTGDLATIWKARGQVPGKPDHRTSSDLGFSLDPWVDPQPLARELRAFAAGNDPLAKGSRRTIEEVASALADKAPFKAPDTPDQDRTRLFALIDAVRAARAGRPVLAIPDDKSFEAIVRRHMFQAPLYLGHVERTEVGMTLFYTDLMAKLCMMGTVPLGEEEGQVRPALAIALAAFHQAEDRRLSRGRLWWGPRPSGFLRSEEHAVRFAPLATRLFLRSKAGETAEEEEAHVRYGSFCARWNHAFLAVADEHPEFHRLNQIMKWSVVLKAAKGAGGPASPWSMLEGVETAVVPRFATWYEQGRAAGRIDGPARLPFVPAASGIAEDSLEIIRSAEFATDDGVIHFLEGGVDAATDVEIATRTMPAGSSPPTGLPPDVRVANAPDAGAGWDRRTTWELDSGARLTRDADGQGRSIVRSIGPLKAPEFLQLEAARGDATTLRTRVEIDGAQGGISVREGLEQGGRVEPASELTVPPAADGVIAPRARIGGLDEVLATVTPVVAERRVAPGTVFASPDGKNLFLKLGKDEASARWVKAAPGKESDPSGMRVGKPGDTDWLTVTPCAEPASGLVELTSPPYLVVGPFLAEPSDPSRPLPPRRKPSWFRPEERTRWSISVGGERSTLGLTADGRLVATGPALRLALDGLRTEDLLLLRDALNAGARTRVAFAHAPLELLRQGETWRLAFTPKADAPLSASDRQEVDALLGKNAELLGLAAALERPTLEKVRHLSRVFKGVRGGLLVPKETSDGWRLDDASGGESHDLGAALEARRRQQPLPESLAAAARDRMLVIDGRGLDGEAEGRLVRQLCETLPDAPFVIHNGEAESDQRLADLLKPEALRDVQALVDSSVLALKVDHEPLRAVLDGGPVVGSGERSIEIVYVHNDGMAELPADLERRAREGRFRGRVVVFVMCALDGQVPRQLAALVRAHGATYVSTSFGPKDFHAGALVFGWLKRHPEALDGATPVQLPNRLYAGALSALDAAVGRIQRGEPAADVLRESFGAAADAVLLDEKKALKPKVIDHLRRVLSKDGASFYGSVDRAAPPRFRLAA